MLKKHLKKAHNRSFCDVCLKNSTSILSEQVLYKPSQLKEHLNQGDYDNEGNLVLLHPHCTVCRLLNLVLQNALLQRRQLQQAPQDEPRELRALRADPRQSVLPRLPQFGRAPREEPLRLLLRRVQTARDGRLQDGLRVPKPSVQNAQPRQQGKVGHEDEAQKREQKAQRSGRSEHD